MISQKIRSLLEMSFWILLMITILLLSYVNEVGAKILFSTCALIEGVNFLLKRDNSKGIEADELDEALDKGRKNVVAAKLSSPDDLTQPKQSSPDDSPISTDHPDKIH